jgi:hypothetical protein
MGTVLLESKWIVSEHWAEVPFCRYSTVVHIPSIISRWSLPGLVLVQWMLPKFRHCAWEESCKPATQVSSLLHVQRHSKEASFTTRYKCRPWLTPKAITVCKHWVIFKNLSVTLVCYKTRALMWSISTRGTFRESFLIVMLFKFLWWVENMMVALCVWGCLSTNCEAVSEDTSE